MNQSEKKGRIGRAGQLLAPGYGWCKKCLTPWRFVEPHTVQITENQGMFALCEACWQESTTEERRMYYGMLPGEWFSHGMAYKEMVAIAEQIDSADYSESPPPNTHPSPQGTSQPSHEQEPSSARKGQQEPMKPGNNK